MFLAPPQGIERRELQSSLGVLDFYNRLRRSETNWRNSARITISRNTPPANAPP
jgi:hypothetical protein